MTKNNMREISKKLNCAFRDCSKDHDFSIVRAALKEAHEEALKDEEYAKQWKTYEKMVEAYEPVYNEALKYLKMAQENDELGLTAKLSREIISDIKMELYINRPNLFDYIKKAS